MACGEPRTRRTFEGNAVIVGVAGRTLTDVCGDRAVGSGLAPSAEDCTELVLEEVEDVFE